MLNIALLLGIIASNPAAVTPEELETPRYTVVAGDTLWALAEAHGVTLATLTYHNNIEDPDLIHVGDELHMYGLSAPPTDYVVPPGSYRPAAVVERTEAEQRAVIRESAELQERAGVSEGTVVMERAGRNESPVQPERAGIAAAAVAAGWPVELAAKVERVAMCESGGMTTAVAPAGYVGLMQVAPWLHGPVPGDAVGQLAQAYRVYQAQGWGAWPVCGLR